MKLIVIGSSSKGNSYALVSRTGQILLLECGVKFNKIKEAINFKLSNVIACLITHEHGDHSFSVRAMMEAGIDVYASRGTHAALKTDGHHRAGVVGTQEYTIGEFKILPFNVKHDAAEPLGFLIYHKECGVTIFITDTYYVPQIFPGLSNIIIEANYSEEILNRVGRQAMPFLDDRIIKSHMSLETCKQMLQANDLKKVNNIVLIHLSDRNSDAKAFKNEIQQLTGKTVHVADSGLIIDFNSTPF